jgi:hypothetical protein
LFQGSITPIFQLVEKPRKTAMMDEALKNHREITFGWVLVLQRVWAALRAPAAKSARRYLAPR